MPRLNHGDELIVPNVPAVRMTMSAEHAVDERHGAAVDARRAGSRGAREPACAPAPMIARLIGIIGRTHGVRFSASPPRNTSAGSRAAPCLEQPGLLDARLGVADELQERSLFTYPPAVPRTSNSIKEFDDICRQGRRATACTAAAAGAFVEGRGAGAGAGGSEGGAVAALAGGATGAAARGVARFVAPPTVNVQETGIVIGL